MRDIRWSTHTTRLRSDIDVPVLMSACPEFANMARSLCGYLRNWNDVHRSPGQLRAIAGISESAWAVEQKSLGSEVSAAVIAVIYDKPAAGQVGCRSSALRIHKGRRRNRLETRGADADLAENQTEFNWAKEVTA